MLKIGIFELFIILFIAAILIVLLVITAKRFIKCKIEPNQKILWLIIMVLFQMLGVIAFFIYHDFILDPQLRANS
jgi:hypothetical protein